MVRLEQFNRQALHNRIQDPTFAKSLAKELARLVNESFGYSVMRSTYVAWL